MPRIIKLALDGVLLLEYDVKQDSRAVFHRTYSRERLAQAGLEMPVEEEIAYRVAKRHTLYGIHFQNRPKAQTKLLYCACGRMRDYAVDLRRGSPTFGQWACVEMAGGDGRQLLIPVGFGHAALTLEDDTHIIMRIDEPFDPSLSRAVHYTDPTLKLDFGEVKPVLSPQDRDAPFLAGSDCNL